MGGSVSSKGQITIPLDIRNQLGIKEGDRVEFVSQGGAIVIRPARVVSNPFEAWAGRLDTFPGGMEEIRSWISALRDEDEP